VEGKNDQVMDETFIRSRQHSLGGRGIMANDAKGLNAIKTGIQVVSEAMFPGGSNLVKGDFKRGATYAALGFAAKAFIGVPAIWLVAASSLSSALTGKNLIEYLDNPSSTTKTPDEEKPETPTRENGGGKRASRG
jgi:hypothetical protein